MRGEGRKRRRAMKGEGRKREEESHEGRGEEEGGGEPYRKWRGEGRKREEESHTGSGGERGGRGRRRAMKRGGGTVVRGRKKQVTLTDTRIKTKRYRSHKFELSFRIRF